MQSNQPLWAHQQRAIDLAKDKDCYALFFEQGTGKTRTVIEILKHEYRNGLQSTLILCPAIVVSNWKAEFLKYSDIPQEDIITLTGSTYERMHDLEHQVLYYKSNRIVITNYEALNLTLLYEKKLLPWKPSILIADESHKIKNVSTKRTKKALALAASATRRYILSGTPIVNSPFDIYSQFLFLDRGATFGADYRAFRQTYFIDENAHRPKASYFPDWQPRMGALPIINKLIYTKAMRVLKSECLDLPPFVRQSVEFELSDIQRKSYHQMEKDAVTEVSASIISADLAIKKALRLQQMTTGFVKDDDDKIQVFPDNPRINALKEVIESIDSSHKIIIWAVFRQNYKDIAGLLKNMDIPYVMVTGEQSAAEKDSAIEIFQKSQSARILIGHPGSAGVGCNLTAASYSINFSRGFSLENDLQSLARNYRGGSEIHEKVTCIDIVAKNTIDEKITNALQNKENISECILKYLKGNTYERHLLNRSG